MTRHYPNCKYIKRPENLIKDNYGYIVQQAIKFSRYHAKAEIDDLIQEGLLSLLKAHSTFDKTLGIRFITHLSWWCKAFMFTYIHSQLDLIYTPTYLRNTKNKITNTWNIHATDAIQSFETVISHSPDGSILKLEDTLHDSGLETKTLQDKQGIISYLDFLNVKHADILKQYYGHGTISPHTFAELGKIHGVSRQCAEQRLKIAVKKLKHIIKIEELKEPK
jgi:RNA polymerase sigma factor (sigma-70 family)